MMRTLTAFCIACVITIGYAIPAYAQTTHTNDSQDKFWQGLQELCGKAFEGTVAAAPSNDTTFRNKTLLMHVQSCGEIKIRIPFMVGENRSRTWVLTRGENQLVLKHDHRHEDGSDDSITMYGGATSNSGSATMQYFPADQQTVDMLPAAGGNVWWIELVPAKHFTYNLRRMGSDRIFSIRFDISKPVAAPPEPWGWRD